MVDPFRPQQGPAKVEAYIPLSPPDPTAQPDGSSQSWKNYYAHYLENNAEHGGDPFTSHPPYEGAGDPFIAHRPLKERSHADHAEEYRQRQKKFILKLVFVVLAAVTISLAGVYIPWSSFRRL